MPVVRAYIRVSHIKSARTDISPEAQKQLTKHRWDYEIAKGGTEGYTWASDGWEGTRNKGVATTDGYYVDRAVSAFKRSFNARPAGGRLEGKMQRGDVLIIAHLDRGFRNTRDFANCLHRWQRRGIRVIFCNPDVDTGSAYGAAFAMMAATFAALDSALKSERMIEVKAMRKKQGFIVGPGPGLGWMRDPRNRAKRIPDNDARRDARLMTKWRLEERMPLRKIGDRIEALIAERENRLPTPEFQFKAGAPVRKWNVEAIKMAIRAVKKGEFPPPTDEPLPPEWVEKQRQEGKGRRPAPELDDFDDEEAA